jgi:hypothetical protein
LVISILLIVQFFDKKSQQYYNYSIGGSLELRWLPNFMVGLVFGFSLWVSLCATTVSAGQANSNRCALDPKTPQRLVDLRLEVALSANYADGVEVVTATNVRLRGRLSYHKPSHTYFVGGTPIPRGPVRYLKPIIGDEQKTIRLAKGSGPIATSSLGSGPAAVKPSSYITPAVLKPTANPLRVAKANAEGSVSALIPGVDLPYKDYLDLRVRETGRTTPAYADQEKTLVWQGRAPAQARSGRIKKRWDPESVDWDLGDSARVKKKRTVDEVIDELERELAAEQEIEALRRNRARGPTSGGQRSAGTVGRQRSVGTVGGGQPGGGQPGGGQRSGDHGAGAGGGGGDGGSGGGRKPKPTDAIIVERAKPNGDSTAQLEASEQQALSDRARAIEAEQPAGAADGAAASAANKTFDDSVNFVRRHFYHGNEIDRSKLDARDSWDKKLDGVVMAAKVELRGDVHVIEPLDIQYDGDMIHVPSLEYKQLVSDAELRAEFEFRKKQMEQEGMRETITQRIQQETGVMDRSSSVLRKMVDDQIDEYLNLFLSEKMQKAFEAKFGTKFSMQFGDAGVRLVFKEEAPPHVIRKIYPPFIIKNGRFTSVPPDKVLGSMQRDLFAEVMALRSQKQALKNGKQPVWETNHAHGLNFDRGTFTQNDMTRHGVLSYDFIEGPSLREALKASMSQSDPELDGLVHAIVEERDQIDPFMMSVMWHRWQLAFANRAPEGMRKPNAYQTGMDLNNGSNDKLVTFTTIIDGKPVTRRKIVKIDG